VRGRRRAAGALEAEPKGGLDGKARSLFGEQVGRHGLKRNSYFFEKVDRHGLKRNTYFFGWKSTFFSLFFIKKNIFLRKKIEKNTIRYLHLSVPCKQG
jgi:hypothetical protein